MTTQVEQYHQPAAEIPDGIFYVQQHGGSERWTERTRAELLADLASDTPPAFRTILGVTELDADGKPARLSGPFYADFDGDLEETCVKFKEFLGKLTAHGVALEQLRLFATGGRGFHVEIPRECFTTQPDAVGLNLAFKELAMALFVDSLDLRVFSTKRMWRTPGVQRENGRFKVPLTPAEALSITPESYADLTAAPRPHPELQPATLAPGLAALFTMATDKAGKALKARKRTSKASENFKRVEGLSLPTLDGLLAGTARLKDSAGWNQVAIQVALMAIGRGWSEAETLDKAAGLIAAHRGDSDRYGTPEKRAQELRTQYRYLQGNAAYAPSIPALLALLDQPAPDLRAAADLLELPTRAEVEIEDPPACIEQPEQVGFPVPYPGTMLEACVSVLQSATKPQPELTTMAVLIGMAASIPGTFSLPDGMRLNLYALGVAETGAGKDAPLGVARSIARAARASCIGLPGSGEGLEDALPDVGPMLCDIDEVAHLLAAVNGSKAPPYLQSLAGNLLRLFSASRREYSTRTLAKLKGREQRTLQNPCLSVVGFSTPATLGDRLKAGNVTDGLLGRFLMARGRDNVVPQWSTTAPDLPYEVEAVARRIHEAGRKAVRILLHRDAEAMLQRLQVELSAKADRADPTGKALMVRSFEKLYRVAGVLAVWDLPEAPEIRPEHVVWASRLVEASDAAMLEFVGAHMHEGEVQANAARVLQCMRDLLSRKPADLGKTDAAFHEARGVIRSVLLKRSRLAARDLEEAVRQLVELGDLVETAEAVPGGRGTNATARVLWLT